VSAPPQAIARDLAATLRGLLDLGTTNRQLLVLLATILIAFSVPLGANLFSGAALRSMGFQMPELGILSCAMMLALLSGGVDLSIIAVANIAALTMAYLLTSAPTGNSGAGTQFLSVFGGLVVALGVGLANGYFIAYRGVSPILATLGTMSVVKGLGIGLTHGGVISGFPESVVFFGTGTIVGVPVPLIVLAAVALPVYILLGWTPFGLQLRMVGANARAVHFSGVDTRRVVLAVYALSGLLAGLAGFLMLARFNSANAAYGESYLLVTILAAVLGGVDPAGGFGKLSGVILALIILQVIATAFNLLDLGQFLALSIWGGTLIVVAFLRRIAGARRSWLRRTVFEVDRKASRARRR
jgi:simple sugar transport system permease protein